MNDRVNCAVWEPKTSPKRPHRQVRVQASVIGSQVCNDSDSIVTSGTRKKMTSHRPAGSPSRYGARRLPRRARRRGGAGSSGVGSSGASCGGPGPGRAHRYPSKIGTKVSFQPVTTLGSCQDG